MIVVARTIFEQTRSRLEPLCESLGFPSGEVTSLLERLVDPWGFWPAERALRWRSEIGDDHTPSELSVSFGREVELRMMVEPLGEEPTLESNRDRALFTLDSLSRDLPIDRSRLEKIQDLYLPERPHGHFSIWLAIAVRKGEPPAVKVYLNPEANGPGLAPAVIEASLERLGFSNAWPNVSQTIAQRGPDRDELKYVSLDLARGPEVRFKVYARHQLATIDDVERAAGTEVRRFLGALAPGTDRFDSRGLWTCIAYSEAGRAVTTHFPINAYAPNERAIHERTLKCLEDLGLDPSAYVRSNLGAHSYVSLKHHPERPRVTVYLPVEAFRPGAVAPRNAPEPPASAKEIVLRYEEQEPITRHPFLRRLRREPPSLERLWILLANFQISISKNFARHLAAIIHRAEDDRVRSILAEQLNDELGCGDYDCAHVKLFQRMMDRLEPWRPVRAGDSTFMPGRGFDRRLAEVYGAEDSWVALGAVMVGEVFGKQIDQFLGEEFRRQTRVDASSLEWLMLHEQLEVEHAEGSLVLAELVPKEKLDAVWSGAHRAAIAGWTFLDDLYRVGYDG